jgi:hypothetical protein
MTESREGWEEERGRSLGGKVEEEVLVEVGVGVCRFGLRSFISAGR